MSNHTNKSVFGTPKRSERDRHEKGSAMSLIAADAEAMEAKSARLKKLRMERDVVAAQEAEAIAAAAPPKKAPAKRKAKAKTA